MTRSQMTDPASDSWPGRARPRFTSRAAVLVVVVCAIALSLAYPVREYIAQLRQISQLQAQQGQLTAQLRQLRAEHRELSSPAYVEQQARERLDMCRPSQTCYIVITGRRSAVRAAAASHAVATPWYERLWSSVRQADAADTAKASRR
jgi:cell division protein FtsL